MALERIYIIPLRKEWEKVPRYRRAKKAVKAVREFLVRHMKLYDRDLRKVKIGRWLNMYLWQRGIKKPPVRVKVKAVKDDSGIVRVELADLPKKALREKEKEKVKSKESGKEKQEGEKKEGKKQEKEKQVKEKKKGEEQEGEKKEDRGEDEKKEGKRVVKKKK